MAKAGWTTNFNAWLGLEMMAETRVEIVGKGKVEQAETLTTNNLQLVFVCLTFLHLSDASTRRGGKWSIWQMTCESMGRSITGWPATRWSPVVLPRCLGFVRKLRRTSLQWRTTIWSSRSYRVFWKTKKVLEASSLIWWGCVWGWGSYQHHVLLASRVLHGKIIVAKTLLAVETSRDLWLGDEKSVF